MAPTHYLGIELSGHSAPEGSGTRHSTILTTSVGSIDRIDKVSIIRWSFGSLHRDHVALHTGFAALTNACRVFHRTWWLCSRGVLTVSSDHPTRPPVAVIVTFTVYAVKYLWYWTER